MNISAKIIADSVSETGKRITTLQVQFPKAILAEFLTHRVFSRNFSSSRAIPVNKVAQLDYFEPVYWGKNKEGMQAKLEEIENKEEAEKIWNDAIKYCRNSSLKLAELGLHKQWSNRIMDWFIMVNGIVTSTEFDNFFTLRIHADAQPEINLLASKMKEAMDNSTPKLLHNYEWHLPYVLEEEKDYYKNHSDHYILPKISAARCCRVSYLKHDGQKPSIEDDLIRFNKLAGSTPKHYSPLEHQATPDEIILGEYSYPRFHGNFVGWIQFRKLDERGLVSG